MISNNRFQRQIRTSQISNHRTTQRSCQPCQAFTEQGGKPPCLSPTSEGSADGAVHSRNLISASLAPFSASSSVQSRAKTQLAMVILRRAAYCIIPVGRFCVTVGKGIGRVAEEALIKSRNKQDYRAIPSEVGDEQGAVPLDPCFPKLAEAPAPIHAVSLSVSWWRSPRA